MVVRVVLYKVGDQWGLLDCDVAPSFLLNESKSVKVKKNHFINFIKVWKVIYIFSP